MKIQYLTKLKDYPYDDNVKDDETSKNEGISLEEINSLEQKWNNGNKFPLALKELLFLAGDYCNVFDYGIFDSQEEFQDFARQDFEESNKIISRPFFVLDYNTGYNFLFVYLDEGDNPNIYVASPGEDNSSWIESLSNYNIKTYSEYAIDCIKKGIDFY